MAPTINQQKQKLHNLSRVMQLGFFTALLLLFFSCSEEESLHKPSVILKTGVAYTASGTAIAQGGKIQIGLLASGAGSPLTYLRIERITGSDTTVQLDRGIWAGSEGYDQDFSFPKGAAEEEKWRIVVMNADRMTSEAVLTVLKAAGADYGAIKHFGPVSLDMQSNPGGKSFLDLDNGTVFSQLDVSGHEQEIDLVPYYYVTSGLPSPTLTCPGYTSAPGYYPVLNSWTVRNNILYDYYTSDNSLISPLQFDNALNDSLLITAYNPSRVSGNCKYAYAGRVIPFKTEQGKYGLVKIVTADESETGTLTLEIKIQE